MAKNNNKMRLLHNILRLSLLYCGALSFVACGYHLLHVNAPFGVSYIAVQPFYEAQAVGMAAPLSTHLIRRLSTSGLVVTHDLTQAQAVLKGSINISTTPSVTRAGVSTYQLGAMVKAQLVDKQGQLLWSNTAVLKEDFLQANGVDIQPLLTETYRRTAILRLAERTAVWLHDNLTIAASQSRNKPS